MSHSGHSVTALVTATAAASVATRRRWLVWAASTGAFHGLTACGFQLRQAPEYAFDTIHVALAEASPLGIELRRQLATSGRLRVLPTAEIAQAQVVLEGLVDARDKVVAALNAAGQVREFQLRVRFKFRLRGKDGKRLIDDTEIMQQREISFSESVALAKEAEEALLYRNMQTDVVQQVLRRLAAVRDV